MHLELKGARNKCSVPLQRGNQTEPQANPELRRVLCFLWAVIPCSSMADWGPQTDAGWWAWEGGGVVLLLVSLQPQLVFTRCWLTRQPPDFLHGSSYSLGFCLPGGISPECPAGTGCPSNPVAFSQVAFRCHLSPLRPPPTGEWGGMMLLWSPLPRWCFGLCSC